MRYVSNWIDWLACLFSTSLISYHIFNNQSFPQGLKAVSFLIYSSVFKVALVIYKKCPQTQWPIALRTYHCLLVFRLAGMLSGHGRAQSCSTISFRGGKTLWDLRWAFSRSGDQVAQEWSSMALVGTVEISSNCLSHAGVCHVTYTRPNMCLC